MFGPVLDYHLYISKGFGGVRVLQGVTILSPGSHRLFEKGGSIVLSRNVHRSNGTYLIDQVGYIRELKDPTLSDEEYPRFIGVAFQGGTTIVWLRLSEIRNEQPANKDEKKALDPTLLYVHPPDGYKPFWVLLMCLAGGLYPPRGFFLYNFHI